MDHQRVHRFGNRTYYRSNYAQPGNVRPTIEERLHAQGISTSSNSSWTFSNSHSDIPKKKKGRLCGVFLMVAVFVVLVAVIAIGGLAFYLGAVRVDNTKQELIFDGSLRVTYGDQYQTVLNNHSSKAYREKSTRYSNMLTNVYQKSVVGPAVDEVTILKFENGSLVVHFRMNLDRRKLPNSVTAVEEVLKSILLEEISSVKPIAFRNLQVDHQNIHIKRYLGDLDSIPESYANKQVETTSAKAVEVKNGVVRKVPPSGQETKHHAKQQNKTSAIPEGTIIGISEKMQNLSDTLKKRQGTIANPVEDESDEEMKSADFDKKTDLPSDGVPEAAVVQVEKSAIGQPEDIPSQQPGDEKFTGPMNGHARPPFEVRVDEPSVYTPIRITPDPGFIASDYDEPWRPIIPSTRESSTHEPRVDVYDELIMAEPPPEEVAPITFSRESYEQNLRIPPEYAGGDKLTRLTEEIAEKFGELVKNQKPPEEHDFRIIPVSIPVEDSSPAGITKEVVMNETGVATPVEFDSSFPLGLDQIISGIKAVGTDAEEDTDEPATETTTTVETTTNKEIIKRVDVTLESENTTVKNPFQDGEDSRAAPAFGFNLPDFPILKQFHHLDSLLKSFSAESSTEELTRPYANETAITRFPVRTKPTDKPEEKVYVAVSTIAPENVTRPKASSGYRSPVVIKGEVQVVDSKNYRSNTATTEPPKLITLLPVRSNLKGPLRPRPKAINSGGASENKKSRMSSEFKTGSSSVPRVLYSIPQKHHFIDDKDGKRWVYYSSSKLLTTTAAPSKPEKLFIVTPEPEKSAKTSIEPTPETTTESISIDSQNLEIEGREEPEMEDEVTPATSNTSELINRIVNIMENVVISSGNSTKVILKVNQTIINGTDLDGAIKLNETNLNDPKFIISNKAVSSHYKLNQAGVPILTKILNKAPSYVKNETETTTEKIVSTTVSNECGKNAMACSNGTCLPLSSRCNQQVDCPDAEDEKNCTCADHLRTQHLNRKLCDGIVDCWDFSDEFNCDWCKGKDYLCSNSKMCIKKSQICDGVNNCPLGDDEKYCVTVSPNEREANSFYYHPNGYLMVRKHGEWGKLCIDNFDTVSMRSKTGWKISDLGRSVCKALTFKDFDKVERMVSVPNEGRDIERPETGRYYELSYNDVTSLEESSTRDSSLSFHETKCTKREVVKVTCTELECGLRPQAMNQWSRIVGGGNANPGSWPWQAALYKEGEFQCGATLISGQWLVSAGHCFYHNQDEYWVARLGTLRTTSSMPSPYEQLRQISKIILHPHYVDTGFINDISLLKMAEPVTFTDFVRPICLPRPNAKIIDGMMCTVVGWGQLFEIGRIFPDTLQEVQLPIISSTECRKRTVFLPLYKITDDMFCAGYDRGGRDACLGDSGGPLMCQESDGKWSLYGVTSNGYGCARSNRPGVYTRVSKYLNWLQSQMHLHSEDEILSQSSLKQLSISGSGDDSRRNITSGHDKATDTLIKLISERVSNVKFSTATAAVKKKDKCKGHRCPLGECLSKSRLCNGFIECSDGSDEKDCW